MYDREAGQLVGVPPGNVSEHLPWYAVRVQAKFEKVASSILREKGFEEFLPLYRARHQWSDRVKQLDLPLFPGYLFCSIDMAAGLLPVVTVPGVLGIVSAGRHPLQVSGTEIQAVRSVVLSGLAATPWPALVAGCPVLIERGPLAGVEGIVLETDKKYRLVVSVSMLQRAVAVEIEREWVRPLAEVGRSSGVLPLGYSLRHLSDVA
jgi:transcription antitermination factor NusG